MHLFPISFLFDSFSVFYILTLGGTSSYSKKQKESNFYLTKMH